jgi:hypothetical protein
MKILLDTVHKLSQYDAVLKSANASLKSQINKLHDRVCQPQESLSPRIGLRADKKIAPRWNTARIYAAGSVPVSPHITSSSNESADRGIS